MKKNLLTIVLLGFLSAMNAQSISTTYTYTWKYDTVYTNQVGQKNFAYTGSSQSYTLTAGTYTLEVWGAQGGRAYYSSSSYGYGYGGKGGYSKGTYTITATQTVYVYVGGQGTYSNSNSGSSSGGYNGGGTGYYYGAGGGGATHISLTNNQLQSIGASNINKILLVAGGGGGGYHYCSTSSSYAYQGGYGGGSSGGSGTGYSYYGYGGSQSSAGYSSYSSSYGCGGFGYGGSYYSSSSGYATGGGGGGLYGGGSSYRRGSGGGGSGYINSSLLTNYQISSGNSSFAATTTGSTETGHSGDGYARISYSFKVIDRIDTSILHTYVTTTISDTICRNGTYNKFGFTADGNLLSPGTHSYTHSNIGASKDSLTVLLLTVKPEAALYEEIDAPYTYTWPVTGETYTQSGVYSYMTTTPEGCDSSIVLALTIYDPTIGINENSDLQNITITPNPAKDYIDISCNSLEGADVYIYNMYAQKCVTQKLKREVTRIFLNNFPAGTYFLRIVNAEKTYKTFKIIKSE